MSSDVEEEYYKLHTHTVESKNYSFYLSKEIGPPEFYTDMVHQIRTANPNDKIFIILNTPGGDVDTGVQIINAMKSSPAVCVAVLESSAHSMGSFIFLAADDWIVNNNCTMLLHNYTGASYGKGNEQEAQIKSDNKMFKEMCEDFYRPFLTQKEITLLLNGKDIWLHSTEISTRLNKVRDEREARILES